MIRFVPFAFWAALAISCSFNWLGLSLDSNSLGESAAQGALEENPNLDGSATTAGSESAQTGNPGGPGGSTVTYLVREYVWGPGDDPGAGVDELFVQYDQMRSAWWVMQDASGDVIALADRPGSGSGGARLVAEHTYDAYGQPIGFVQHHPHAFLRAGHKGLLFDRLDLGVAGHVNLREHRRRVGRDGADRDVFEFAAWHDHYGRSHRTSKSTAKDVFRRDPRNRRDPPTR